MAFTPLADLFHLFVPRRCGVCGATLVEGEHHFCVRCLMGAPFTDHPSAPYNRLIEHLRESVPVEHAAALLMFPKGSAWRRAVHDFKYRGHWRVARHCGEWLGGALAEGGGFYDVDVVVPIPLHPRKVLRRGYNQADYVARGVAAMLSRPCVSGNLRRVKNNPSQTHKRTSERWENVAGIFAVSRPEEFAGKHILLIDDVVTSGATITSAAEAILRACPGARVSVAAFATARYS